MSRTSVRSLFHRGGELAGKFVREPGFRQAPLQSLKRVAEWRVRCWLGRPAVILWSGHEPLRMVLPPVWTSAYVSDFAFRGIHHDDRELSWLTSWLEPGSVCVDVGANVGQWTLPLAQHVGPKGRVVAIEPAEATSAALTRSLRVNGLGCGEVVRVAAAERDGTALLHHHGRDPSQHSLGDVGGETEEVRTCALDSLLAELDVVRVDAVKLDVEGAEELVLRGSTRMLSEQRPTIIFELVPGLPERQGLESDGAWRLLIDAGYWTYQLDAMMDLSPVAPEDIAGQVASRNVIALPVESARHPSAGSRPH
jgi:FkbM family methyltransferase